MDLLNFSKTILGYNKDIYIIQQSKNMAGVDPKHVCKRCGNLGVILETNTVHAGGKVVCPSCISNGGDHLFIAWQAKDKVANDKKRKLVEI